ncbi:MAG: Na+/H+ antiporter NhaA [Gammaproteobacteria bacterium]|nr:Na+/H+ antiporter NhaA [Gammaproteobacteria bacterium]
MTRYIKHFIDQTYFSGFILFFAAILALGMVNSPLQSFYIHFLSFKMGVHIGDISLTKPVLMWINEGLMTIFFLLVGLEIKRELFEGELNSFNKAILPVIGAIGGMLIPSLIFVALNFHDATALRGWAIPSATDIAFALGVLSLFSTRIPLSLKVFLTALAIIDDLGAILIIAVFYSNELSFIALALAGMGVIALVVLNRCHVTRFTPYLMIGIFMWVCVLHSGVHATLTGVIVALAYPLKDPKNPQRSPSHAIETALLPWANYLVLPLFAFANAGLPLNPAVLTSVVKSIPLGTILGLFIGKQLGVFGCCWIAIKMKWTHLPKDASWRQFYAVTVLAGIGFTMSLFIGTLAYDGLSAQYIEMVRLGVLVGSLFSAVLGSVLLRQPVCCLEPQREG